MPIIWLSRKQMSKNETPSISFVNVTFMAATQMVLKNLQVQILNSTFSLSSTTRLSALGDIVLGKANQTNSKNPSSIMHLQNSTTLIGNCEFIARTSFFVLSSSVIKASRTQLTILDTVFDSIKSKSGLIQLENTSHITMRNVSMKGNGLSPSTSLVQLLHRSSGEVTESVFQSNKAQTGSCFSIGPSCHLVIGNSHFMDNMAKVSGGVIFCESNSTIMIKHSLFDNNRASGGGTIRCQDEVDIAIFNSSFQNVSCDKCRGAVLNCGDRVSMSLKGSRILQNKAYYSLLHMGKGSHVDIQKTEFFNNTCTYYIHNFGSGVLMSASFSNISIRDSSFENNSAQVFDFRRATVNIDQCKISENIAPRGVISIGQNTAVHVNNSVFHNNTPLHSEIKCPDPSTLSCCVLCFNGGVASAIIENSSFSLNNVKEGRVVLYTLLSTVVLKNCRFDYLRSDIVASGLKATYLVESCKFQIQTTQSLKNISSLESRQLPKDSFLQQSHLKLQHCSFYGGVYFLVSVSSTVEFHNCSLPGSGRIIANSGCSVLFHSCTLNNHTTGVFGGAFLLVHVTLTSQLTVNNCSLVEKSVLFRSTSDSRITMSDSELSDLSFLMAQGSLVSLKSVKLFQPKLSGNEYMDRKLVTSFENCDVTMHNITAQSSVRLTYSNSNITLNTVHIENALEDTTGSPTIQILCKEGLNNALVIQDTKCEGGAACILLTLHPISLFIVENSELQIDAPNVPQHTSGIGTTRQYNSHIVVKEEDSENEFGLWPLFFSTYFTWSATMSNGNESVQSSDNNFVLKAIQLLRGRNKSQFVSVGNRSRNSEEANNLNHTLAVIPFGNTSVNTPDHVTMAARHVTYVNTPYAASKSSNDCCLFLGQIPVLGQREAAHSAPTTYFLHFSAKQHSCGPCFCYFDIKSENNIFNCSHMPLSRFPPLPANTQTLLLTDTKLKEVTVKNIEQINEVGSVKIIHFDDNFIRTMPKQIESIENVDEIYLGGNPFLCDCDMTWMIGWLKRRVNSTGNSLVGDIRNTKCDSGKYNGLPIYLLSDVLLGCYPHSLTTLQKVAIAIGALVTVLIFSLITVAVKKSKEVKFLLFYYLRLKTLPKDKGEDVKNKEYDAFFCYW